MRGFPGLLRQALERRLSFRGSDTARLFAGAADGMAGVHVDRYGPGIAIYAEEAAGLAGEVLRQTAPWGVRAVYAKASGDDPALRDSRPAAGEPLPESFLVAEGDLRFEVRMYDGYSTGLFLDQRANRAGLAGNARGLEVLNLFAYTCAFSVALARAGATTTNVDLSARYLDWGRRNFAHNGIDASPHRFLRRDARDFLDQARRKGLRYDLVIVDPPTFSAGNRRQGVPPWAAEREYGGLVAGAAPLLRRGGSIFASTNAGDLCAPGRLEREVVAALGREPRWLALPPPPADLGGETGRLACLWFTP